MAAAVGLIPVPLVRVVLVAVVLVLPLLEQPERQTQVVAAGAVELRVPATAAQADQG